MDIIHSLGRGLLDRTIYYCSFDSAQDVLDPGMASIRWASPDDVRCQCHRNKTSESTTGLWVSEGRFASVIKENSRDVAPCLDAKRFITAFGLERKVMRRFCQASAPQIG